MTAQTFPFLPSSVVAPSFQPVLDGHTCNVAVTFNVAAQRYYINVYNSDGSLAVAMALVTSPPGVALASLSWDQNQKIVTAILAQPWYRPTGQIVRYSLQDCQPDTFNGVYECLVINPTTFTFASPTNPGPISVLGSVQRDLNMLAGWFQSSMVFRDGFFIVRP